MIEVLGDESEGAEGEPLVALGVEGLALLLGLLLFGEATKGGSGKGSLV